MWDVIAVGLGVLTVFVGVVVWRIPHLPPRYRAKADDIIPLTRGLTDTRSRIETSASGVHHTITDAGVCAEFKSYVDEHDPKGTPEGVPQSLTVESGHVYATFPDGSARTYLQMDDERAVLSELLTAAVARRYRNYGILIAINGGGLVLLGAVLRWL